MTDDQRLFAGVELGGTKCVAVLGNAGRMIERAAVPTALPDETLPALAAVLGRWRAAHHIEALGIGSFGPIRIDRAAADHGRMLATPKPGWAGADIVGGLARGFRHHGLQTDVTAAALAERAYGAARGLDDLIYVTIGTGVGIGIIAGGRAVAGMLHPEAGHIRVRRRPDDHVSGVCPAHGDCLEGLVSGPAIAARFGASEAPGPDDPRWAPVAEALAEGLAMLLLTLSPARIVIGGGVALGRPHLIAQARGHVAALLAGYLPDADAPALARRIVPAALGADAGPLGTLLLARDALREG